jgi:hypothetical protein
LETLFPKNYVKAHQCDGFHQLCEIGHKIEKNSENSTELPETGQKIQQKKTIILWHKIINKETKEQFQQLVDGLWEGHGILTIDFKKNITLGRGAGSLGKVGALERDEQSLVWCS